MNWQIAKAKQKFSKLVKAAEVEPQWIYNRGKLVAALVPGPELKAYLSWRRRKEARTLGAAFEELRRICEEEDYSFDAPTRSAE